MSSVAYLLVTCCLEQSRYDLLSKVVPNLIEQDPSLVETLTVFDNASTHPGTDVLLHSFGNVYRADRNVGYWSAIHWWLQQQTRLASPPAYTYIIESDVIHYRLDRLKECTQFLDANPTVGSVRLHEYSVENFHLYNKDVPHPGSRRNIWQSHTNSVTHEGIRLRKTRADERGIWSTNFLTQLPALNRFGTMLDVFNELAAMKGFNEHQFQKLYWGRYQQTGILNGGMFHNELNPYGANNVQGSWTDPRKLQQLGYQTTRQANITPLDQYTATRVA